MGTPEEKPQPFMTRIRTAIDTMEAEKLDALFLIIVMGISAAIILVLNATGYSW